MTRDDRLTRKALHLLDASRQPDGFLQAEYPSRYPAIIAPFSPIWIEIWDYAHWRVNPNLVRTLLPGMRSTLEAFAMFSADGLLHAPEGWNFMDWTDSWGDQRRHPAQRHHWRERHNPLAIGLRIKHGGSFLKPTSEKKNSPRITRAGAQNWHRRGNPLFGMKPADFLPMTSPIHPIRNIRRHSPSSAVICRQSNSPASQAGCATRNYTEPVISFYITCSKPTACSTWMT